MTLYKEIGQVSSPTDTNFGRDVMADMLDNEKMEDDEYEFGGSEDEYMPEYEEASPDAEVSAEPELAMGEEVSDMPMQESSSMVQKLMRFGLIAVGTAAVAAYLIFSERTKVAEEEGVPQESQSSINSIAAAPQAEPTPVPTPAPVVEPVQQAQSQTVTPDTGLSQEAQTRLAAQQSQMLVLAQQVKANKLALDNVLVRMETLQETVQKGLDKVESAMKKPKTAVVQKKAKRVKKAQKVADRPRKARVIRALKAVIPGRAWIEDKSGHTHTVSIGTRIPSLGTVQIIDPAKGRVITNTGATIVYGPDDY